MVERLLKPLVDFLSFKRGIPEADAEELAADVLMTVYDKVKGYRQGRAKLTTWIFQIAKNRAVDYYRRAEPEPLELADDLIAWVPDGEAKYAGRNNELMRWLLDQLEAFSATDRDLLKWRAKEIPYAQIAIWLGIPEGTARVRHKRALETLLEKAKEIAFRKGAANL